MSGEHQCLSHDAGAQESEINDLRSEVQQERSNLFKARKMLAHAEQKHHALRSNADARIRNLQAAIAGCLAEHAALQVRYDLLLNSTIWRLSAPIRSVVDAAPLRMRLYTRRLIKFLYWIVTPHKMLPRIAFRQARKVGEPDVPPAADLESVRVDETPPAATSSDLLTKMPADAAASELGKIEDIGQEHVSIGIVAFHNSAEDIHRILASAHTALARCGGRVSGEIRILDNGGTLKPGDLPSGTLLDIANNPGFGSGHNLCMKAAFENGATVYLAAHPDGSFHPDCIRNILAMHQAQGRRALIEARQCPEEHPKYYDPADLTTPWVSSACLLIPQEIWEQTGGFDPNFFIYFEDVDLSWKCRTLGFKTLICPSALFWHDLTGRPHETWRSGAMLLAGRYLGYKWGNPSFMEWAENRLIKENFVRHSGELPPLDDLPTVSEDTGVADFRFSFHFAPVRW